jgi:hypothetical protein
MPLRDVRTATQHALTSKIPGTLEGLGWHPWLRGLDSCGAVDGY